MMNPRRFTIVAPAFCGSLVLAGVIVGWLAGFGSAGTENTGAVPIENGAASLAANARLADEPQAIAMANAAAANAAAAAAKIDATAVEPRRASRARNRFAAFSIAASLVVAVCVGMQDLRQSWLQERDRVAALTRELATARRGLETEVAQSSKATEEADQLRQAANAARAELEQERSRSAALARDLESAQRMIAARSTTGGPAGNQPDPMKQGSRRELWSRSR